ncbi:MAG TPA: type II secretion system F family protein [Actinomadura sp.]|jgi:tight adherence protein C|nr:type II secretion system F family protein [Actinomadura sp.]
MSILAMAAGAALTVILAVWGFALMTADERVAASAVPKPSKPKQKNDTFILNVVADLLGRPFTGLAMEVLAPRRIAIRRRIDAAGRPGGMTVESYARQTAGYFVMFGSIGLLLMLSGQWLLGALCLLGGLQNEFLLYARMQERQDQVQRSMPDFLDVLAVTVTAGLSFRLALARVAESMPGPLAEEFMVALRQMELGTSRREAFEDLRSRNSSEAVSQFVTAFLQAEELGAPLSTALKDISEDMRRESAQWAKRKAQRATPRITMVTTALTLPSLMLIVLGSLFYSSGANIGGIFGS